MTNLDPSASRMSSPTSPRRDRWSVGIRRGMQSPPLPACRRCRSPDRSSAGCATDRRYRPGAPVYRPCVVTVDDAIVAIQRDDQRVANRVLVFKSACLGISVSDECRTVPKISGRASLGCRPGVSATARACPVDWARGGHGDEGRRTADLARVSQLDCDARSSARRAGVLGAGSVIGGARTSNLGIGGSMGRARGQGATRFALRVHVEARR
jgi:hypothetical protein